MSTRRILCFGDSLTEGWYNNGFKFHPYTLRLQELFKDLGNCWKSVEILNKGISGEVVYPEMVARLPKILKNEGPFDFAIILGGTNDLADLSNAKKADLSKNIEHLHELAHKEGIKTCAVTIPETAFDILPFAAEYVKYREEVNNSIRDFVTNHQEMVHLCDIASKLPMYGVSESERAKYWDDELHFTPQGYDRMAELIFEDIKNFI